MKRIFTLFLVVFAFVSLKAQIFVDGTPLKREEKYLTVILVQYINFSSKVSYNYEVFIEQNKNNKFSHWVHLTDENGKKKRFLTINEAIIYFEDNGYSFKNFGVELANESLPRIYLLFEQNKADLTTDENNGN